MNEQKIFEGEKKSVTFDHPKFLQLALLASQQPTS